MPPSPRRGELDKVGILPILPFRLRGLTPRALASFLSQSIEAELRHYGSKSR